MADNTVEHGTVEEAPAEVRDGLVRAEEARRVLVAELAGLGVTMTAAMDAHPGFVPCGHAFAVVIDGLAGAATATAAAELEALAEAARARSEHVAAHRGVSQGDAAYVRTAMGKAAGVATMRAHLLAELMGIALAAQRGMAMGTMSNEVNVYLVNSLAALAAGEDTENVHECLMRSSAAAAQAFSLVA